MALHIIHTQGSMSIQMYLITLLIFQISDCFANGSYDYESYSGDEDYSGVEYSGDSDGHRIGSIGYSPSTVVHIPSLVGHSTDLVGHSTEPIGLSTGSIG